MDIGSSLTVAHISFGSIAVLAGFVALAVRKGAAPHINAGRAFAVTMILASGVGSVLGLLKLESHYITFHAGILGMTLVASGWLTARSQSSGIGPLRAGVGVINLVNTLVLIATGMRALSFPDAMLFGFHAGDYFFLSGMAGLAAMFDISLLFRKPLSNKHRIARHLWRMCLGFFIAAGSAFTGPGATVFPEPIRNSGILSAPELIIILLLLFWLFRTLFGKFSTRLAGAG